jgi:hypothetical protein
MSEERSSFAVVILFAIVTGVLAYFFQFRAGDMIEKVLAVAAGLFCLFVLIKQRWALVGLNLTLLVAIAVYFIWAWYLPIIQEDPSLIWPNVLKMLVGIVLFIIFGRQRVEFSHFSKA